MYIYMWLGAMYRWGTTGGRGESPSVSAGDGIGTNTGNRFKVQPPFFTVRISPRESHAVNTLTQLEL